MDKAELIKQIEAGEVVLSHSSFNEFCKSPQHFIAHKLRQRVSTPAMQFGSMVHCLVLEPDDFPNRYAVAPECDRRTTVGKNTWNDFVAQVPEGCEVVTAKDYEDAQQIAKNLLYNPSSAWVFDNIGQTEIRIDWEYKGLKWRGFIDAKGDEVGIIADLKILADASPNRVERYIKYDGAGRQLAHYRRGAKCPKHDCYIVAADRSGGVSVVKVGKPVLDICDREIDWYITKFKECIFRGAWNESYDFFTPNGIHEMNAW